MKPGTLLLTPHCCDLSYSSRNETELGRINRKRRKIRARLGEKEWLKPNGMHQMTFDRQRARLIEAEIQVDELFLGVWVGRDRDFNAYPGASYARFSVR